MYALSILSASHIEQCYYTQLHIVYTMIIQNFHDLATSSRKKESLQILEAGLRAADPEAIIPKFVTRDEIRMEKKTINVSEYSAIYTVAFGKAGDSMTRAFNGIIPVKGGIIVIPKGSRSVVLGKKFQIFNSGHPRPDRTSVKAAKEIVKFLQNRRDGELVVFLVSGGGSSLLSLPDGITLDDKIHATDLLLKSGATIQDLQLCQKTPLKDQGRQIGRGFKVRRSGTSNVRCTGR